MLSIPRLRWVIINLHLHRLCKAWGFPLSIYPISRIRSPSHRCLYLSYLFHHFPRPKGAQFPMGMTSLPLKRRFTVTTDLQLIFKYRLSCSSIPMLMVGGKEDDWSAEDSEKHVNVRRKGKRAHSTSLSLPPPQSPPFPDQIFCICYGDSRRYNGTRKRFGCTGRETVIVIRA